MNYLQGVDDSFEDEVFEKTSSRSRRARLNLGIFVLILGFLGTSLAANISLNNGNRKEFGQGIFQIKACDQWVGVGLTAGSGAENPYVKNLKLYGFDPRLCLGRIFRIKLFPTGSTTPLNLYIDQGASAGTTETATQLTLVDTSTAFTTNYLGASTSSQAYDWWAADAVTLVNRQGLNVGYYSDYLFIDYTTSTGVYTIIFNQPRALVASVASVTIESAKYS